jgi:uncharacterized damage-inducible protein DinB
MQPPPETTATRHIVWLQALKASPERAAALLAPLPIAAHTWRPAPDEWSLLQLVSHLAAAEPPFLGRMQRIVAEDHPWLPYFGPDVARPSEAGTLPAFAEAYRAERERLLAFLAALPLAAWDRPATHETMGETTFVGQIQNIAHHDAEHLDQLHALCQAWDNQGHG